MEQEDLTRKLARLVEKAGECYSLARVMALDAENYLADVQRLMDVLGLDRLETARFVAARAVKTKKVRLETK